MTQSLTPYADYLLQLDLEGSNLHSVEAKSVRESDLDVLYVHQTGGRNDPPSSNFILALPLSDIGRGRFDFGAGAFEAELGPGDVLVEPPGVACLYDIPDHAEVRAFAVSLSCAWTREVLSAVAGRSLSDFGRLHAQAVRAPHITHLVEDLWRTERAGRTRGGLYAEGAMLSLLGALLQLSGQPELEKRERLDLRDRRIRRAIEWIDAHLTTELRLADIARVAGLSPSSLARVFKSLLGLTPIQYVQQRRVERAKVLLREEAVSIIEVAAAVGYENPQHFATLFKRLVGTSPSSYRRSAK